MRLIILEGTSDSLPITVLNPLIKMRRLHRSKQKGLCDQEAIITKAVGGF